MTDRPMDICKGKNNMPTNPFRGGGGGGGEGGGDITTMLHSKYISDLLRITIVMQYPN